MQPLTSILILLVVFALSGCIPALGDDPMEGTPDGPLLKLTQTTKEGPYNNVGFRVYYEFDEDVLPPHLRQNISSVVIRRGTLNILNSGFSVKEKTGSFWDRFAPVGGKGSYYMAFYDEHGFNISLTTDSISYQ